MIRFPKNISVSVLILIVFFGSQCTLKKRNYRKGYYIEWSHHKKNTAKVNAVVNSDGKPAEIKYVVPIDALPLADASKIIIPEKNSILPVDENPKCDSIFFRSGKVAEVKVTEINPEQIKYKRCDMPDGPTMVVNKNDVAGIRYSNGVLETFQIKYKDPQPTDYSRSGAGVRKADVYQEKKTHPLAWWVLGCTIGILVPLVGYVSWLGVLILAPIALRKIREQPNIYTGQRMVRTCLSIVCSILAFALAALVLAFLI